MSSLCIADALNILNSIGAIAKSVHRERVSSDSAVPHMSTSLPTEVPYDPDEVKESIKDRTVGSSPAANTAEDITATAHEGPQNEESMSLASQLEAVPKSSGPPSPVTSHTTREELSVQISSDERDSETESDDPPGSDEDGTLDSGHVAQSPRSCAGKEATVNSELGETGTVSSSKEDEEHGCEVRGGVSMFSHVKGKFFNSKNGESKPKKGRKKKDNWQKTEHRDLSSRQSSSSKPSRRKSKPLLLYGMGAGSFNVVESYMNS